MSSVASFISPPFGSSIGFQDLRHPAGISSISPPNTDGPVILTARADAKYLAALHAPSASDNG
jgi:hypothetical protein